MESDQEPQIYISDDNSYNLPFAFNPNYKPSLPTIKQTLNENKSTLIEDIAKGALIGGGILLTGYIIGSIISGGQSSK